MKKYGFTLAEVLITLAVIGVIASMTIPGLLSSSNKAQYEVGLKKAYTVVNQALRLMALENGGLSSIFSGSLASQGDEFSSYFNVTKNCSNSVNQDCMSVFNLAYDGSSAPNDLNTGAAYYKFVTADGMIFVLNSFSNECTTDYGLNANSPSTRSCGQLFVDINGKKGPNFFGRDVFDFYITNNRAPMLYAYGSQEVDFGTGVTEGDGYWNFGGANKCSPSAKYGRDCTGRIIEKTWVMDY